MTNNQSVEELDLDELHAEAVPWYPHRPDGKDQPDTITGTVVDIAAIEDMNGDTKLRIDLKADDGKVWGLRTYPAVLHAAWRRAAPQIGERVSVRYLGKIENRKKGMSDYPNFSVKPLRDTTPQKFDYSKVGGMAPQADVESDVPISMPEDDAPLPF
jgi:hypothetical protein